MLNNNDIKKICSSLICVSIGLLCGFIIMLCFSPVNAIKEFIVFIDGGLGYLGLFGFGKILALFAPLLCCTISIIFAYKIGFFNIGIIGQFIFGSFGALIFALKFKQHWIICFLFAAIFSSFLAAIPAILKIFYKVNEVISGIMLNWISLFFVNHFYMVYLKDIVNAKNGGRTFIVNGISKISNLNLEKIFGNVFSIAFIIAILIAIIAYIVIEKTIFGFEIKTCGNNKNVAEYVGINANKNIILTMIISGALAGIAAAMYYLSGIEEWNTIESNVLPSLPFNGIVAAFIAQLNPIGAIFSSFFIALTSLGSTTLNQLIFPKEISDLIISIIIYLNGFKFDNFFNFLNIENLKKIFKKKCDDK